MNALGRRWPPHCRDCGKVTHSLVLVVPDRHEWWCGSCEYLRKNPDAPKAKPVPREARPKRLQRERLFEIDPG